MGNGWGKGREDKLTNEGEVLHPSLIPGLEP